jgi:hypothetical protein
MIETYSLQRQIASQMIEHLMYRVPHLTAFGLLPTFEVAASKPTLLASIGARPAA